MSTVATMRHNSTWRIAAALVVSLLPGGLFAQPAANHKPGAVAATGAEAAATLRAKGLEAGYNLDHDDALEAFRAAITANPDNPAAYRLVAAAFWIKMLWRQGTVTVDDYFGRVDGDLARTPPPPVLEAAFRVHVNKAIELGEYGIRQNPADPESHYQLGAACGLLTSYQTTIEGRIAGSLRTARRAYGEQQRALSLDPGRKDAGLQLGMYRYGVSTLSAPLRLFAGLAGLGGGRDRGIRLVEEAASYPGESQTNARLTLVAIYNREARYDDALRMLEQLQRLYPRNRLLWFEAASTALRAQRLADARAWNDAGLKKLSRDPRPRAFNEDARWKTQQAAILAALKKAGHS